MNIVQIVVQGKNNSLNKIDFIVDPWMVEFIIDQRMTFKDMYAGIVRKNGDKTPTTGFKYTIKYRIHPIDRNIVPVTESNFWGKNIYSVAKLMTGVAKLLRQPDAADNDLRQSAYILPEDYKMPFTIKRKYNAYIDALKKARDAEVERNG